MLCPQNRDNGSSTTPTGPTTMEANTVATVMAILVTTTPTEARTIHPPQGPTIAHQIIPTPTPAVTTTTLDLMRGRVKTITTMELDTHLNPSTEEEAGAEA